MDTIASDAGKIPATRVSRRHHPVVTALLPSGAGGALALGSAAFLGGLHGEIADAANSDAAFAWLYRVAGNPVEALALGASLGCIAAMIERAALRRSAPWIAAKMRGSGGEPPMPVRVLQWLTWLPSVVALLAAIAIGWHTSRSPVVAAFASLAPLILTYRTERSIYDMARGAQGPSST